jgi:RNA polymerase-binding protein DksA
MTSILAPAQRSEFSSLLKRRYRELWDDVQREVTSADTEPYQEIAGEVHDRQDESVADVVVDVNLAAIHRDVGEMRDIEAALERLSSGVYGICVECGSEIPQARLHAYPTAKRCRACQEFHERTHLRTTGPTL